MVPLMTPEACPVYLIALSRLSGHLNKQNKPKLKHNLNQHTRITSSPLEQKTADMLVT